MPLVNYGCIDLHHMSLLSSGRKLGTVNSSQSQLGRYSRLQSQQKQSKNKKTRTQLPAQKISWPDIRWPGHNSLEKKHPNFPISWINISFYFFIIINEYLKNHKSNQSKRFQVMRLPMNSIYFFFYKLHSKTYMVCCPGGATKEWVPGGLHAGFTKCWRCNAMQPVVRNFWQYQCLHYD